MASNVRTSSCFLLLAVLFCMFHYSASSHGKNQQQKLSSAIVVGTVNCDSSSFGRDLSKSSHFITGASVAVECTDGAAGPSFRKEIKTNQRGVFRVRLPTGVDVLKGCSVRLIRSSEPFCSVAASATSAELRLESKRNGLQVFSAGRLTFKPLASDPKSASPAERKQAHPAFFFPPPIPFLPSPPNVGGVPLPPNPLLPPPALLPPLVPSPPPSLLPPFLPTPPPAPFIGIPPFPFPTPTSPPPPASIFPPLPPNPLFPGIPPASPAAKTSP